MNLKSASKSIDSISSEDEDQCEKRRPRTTELEHLRRQPQWLLDEQQSFLFWKQSLTRFCVEKKLDTDVANKDFGIYANYRILYNEIQFDSELPEDRDKVLTIGIPQPLRQEFNDYVKQYSSSVGQLLSLWVPLRSLTSKKLPISCVTSTFNLVNIAGQTLGLGVFHQNQLYKHQQKQPYQFYYIVIYDTILKCLCEIDMFQFISSVLDTLMARLTKIQLSDEQYWMQFKSILLDLIQDEITDYFQKQIVSDEKMRKDPIYAYKYDQTYLNYLQQIDQNRYEFIILDQKEAENATFLELRKQWDEKTKEKDKQKDPQIEHIKQISFDYIFLDIANHLHGKLKNPIPIYTNYQNFVDENKNVMSEQQMMLQIGFNINTDFIDYQKEYGQSQILKKHFQTEQQLIHNGKSLSYGKTLKRNLFLQSFASSSSYGSSGSLVIQYDTAAEQAEKHLANEVPMEKVNDAQMEIQDKQDLNRIPQEVEQENYKLAFKRFSAIAISTCNYEDDSKKVNRILNKITKKETKNIQKAQENMKNAAIIHAETEKKIEIIEHQEVGKQTITKNIKKQENKNKRKQQLSLVPAAQKNVKIEQQQEEDKNDEGLEDKAIQIELSKKHGENKTQEVKEAEIQENVDINEQDDQADDKISNPTMREWENCLEKFTQDQIQQENFLINHQDEYKTADRDRLWKVLSRSESDNTLRKKAQYKRNNPQENLHTVRSTVQKPPLSNPNKTEESEANPAPESKAEITIQQQQKGQKKTLQQSAKQPSFPSSHSAAIQLYGRGLRNAKSQHQSGQNTKNQK